MIHSVGHRRNTEGTPTGYQRDTDRAPTGHRLDTDGTPANGFQCSLQLQSTTERISVIASMPPTPPPIIDQVAKPISIDQMVKPTALTTWSSKCMEERWARHAMLCSSFSGGKVNVANTSSAAAGVTTLPGRTHPARPGGGARPLLVLPYSQAVRLHPDQDEEPGRCWCYHFARPYASTRPG